QELHELGPAAHLTRCRELAAHGWRLVTIALAEQPPGQGPCAASVWHRPVIPETVRDARAREQANAAVALLQLGQAESVWPCLRHRPDPRLRTYLIHRWHPLGGNVQLLLRRLEVEREVS